MITWLHSVEKQFCARVGKKMLPIADSTRFTLTPNACVFSMQLRRNSLRRNMTFILLWFCKDNSPLQVILVEECNDLFVLMIHDLCMHNAIRTMFLFPMLKIICPILVHCNLIFCSVCWIWALIAYHWLFTLFMTGKWKSRSLRSRSPRPTRTSLSWMNNL